MFTVGDVAAMGAAILQAIDKREDLRQMGQAARALAEDRADWQKNFQSLFKAYKIAQEYAKLG
jgi:glycosyltransferase involved in cell wall biosynthesis